MPLRLPTLAHRAKRNTTTPQVNLSEICAVETTAVGSPLAEYQNPNQQGGGNDTRSLLIYSFIFIAILLGMQYFRPAKPAATPQPATPATASTPVSPSVSGPVSSPMLGATSPASPAANAAPTKAAANESTTVVENDLYRITFSNRGGQVTSWILKKYTDDNGKPLELVNQKAASLFGYPLSAYTYDAGLRTQLAQALYVPSVTGTVKAPGAVTFEYAAGGLEVKKSFRFDESYVIHADISVTLNGAPVETLLAWPGGFGDQNTSVTSTRGTSSYTAQLDTSSNGKDDSIAAKKVSGGNTLFGPFDWAGVSDLYFAAIFLPDTPDQSTMVTLSHELPATGSNSNGKKIPQIPMLGAAVGNPAGTTSLRVFVGPKSIKILRTVRGIGPDGMPTGANVAPIIHYGMMAFIAKPLFWALRWIHSHIASNWGWSILLLTVLITSAMLPTRITMMKSSIKMQRIQPQLNAIKERYKKYKFDDPRKQDMNKEMTALYKEEGVNMFGGCLPMLIQFPLLFAFYAVLENSIELRHAHWLWLYDLAKPDPYHILPITMIVAQFLTQMLTPQPGIDPAQQKMMAFMTPIMFGFFTWNSPSGMALYWACSTLIGIGIQMGINQTSLGQELRAIQAKRAAKKLGKPALMRR